ncbi:MAG: tetratricopeptide repeat protein, partial [Bdellovibrionales bacterium]|nr:tetratricopeptide repeat protein [Bdellovibrionales bacterium]
MFSSKQYQESYRVLEKRLKNDVTKESRQLTLFGLGVAAYESGDFEKAKEHLTEGLSLDSRLADYYHYYLGRTLRKLDDKKGAKEHFRKVETFQPQSQKIEDARFDLAEMAIEDKKWGEARQHLRFLERKWRNTERYVPVTLMLIQSENKSGRKWVGCRWARKLYRQYPGSPELTNWGIDLQKAEIGGEKSGCVASLYDQKKRIRNLQHSGQSVRAREEIETLQKRTADSQRYWVDSLLAEFLIQEGLVQDAMSVLKPYYEAKKSDADYLMLFAKAASRAEEYQTAVGAYYRVFNLHASSRVARRALFEGSFLSYQYKDYDGALRKFDEFQKRYRGSGLARDATWYQSWINYLRGDYKAAKSTFKKVISSSRFRRRNPKMTEKMTYWLAMGHLKAGELADAKEAFEKISPAENFGYYAIAARARLVSLKDVTPRSLAKSESKESSQEKSDESSSEVVVASENAEVAAVEPEAGNSDETKEDENSITQENQEDEEEEDVASSDPVTESTDESAPVVTTFKDPRLAERFERASDLEALGFNEMAKWELWAIERRTVNRDYLRSLMAHYE